MSGRQESTRNLLWLSPTVCLFCDSVLEHSAPKSEVSQEFIVALVLLASNGRSP